MQIREGECKPSNVFTGSRHLSQYLRSLKQLQFSGQRMGEESWPFTEFWRHEEVSLGCLAWEVSDLKASGGLRNPCQESWQINPLWYLPLWDCRRLWPVGGLFHPKGSAPFHRTLNPCAKCTQSVFLQWVCDPSVVPIKGTILLLEMPVCFLLFPSWLNQFQSKMKMMKDSWRYIEMKTAPPARNGGRIPEVHRD